MEGKNNSPEEVKTFLDHFYVPEFDSNDFIKLFFAHMILNGYDMYDRSLMQSVLHETKNNGMCLKLLKELSFKTVTAFPVSEDLLDAEYMALVSGLMYNYVPSPDDFYYIDLSEEYAKKLTELHDAIYQKEMKKLFKHIEQNYPKLLKKSQLTRTKHT